MSGEGQSLFNLEQIFKICSDKNFSGETGLGLLISYATYQESWTALVKWIRGQLELGRMVNIPYFGHFSYRSQEKDTYINVVLNEEFLKRFHLNQKLEGSDLTQPTVKLNANAVAKLTEGREGIDGRDSQLVSVAVNRMLNLIGEIFVNYDSCEIDIGLLGKFVSTNRQIMFIPTIKSKASAAVTNKQTVKGLIDANGSFNKGSFLQKKNTERSQVPQETIIVSGDRSEMQQPKGQLSFSPIKRLNDSSNGGKQINPLSRSKLLSSRVQPQQGQGQSVLSPSKRQKNAEDHLLEELLGAGSDPLDRNQNFAHLISNPADLMGARFTKPSIAKVRFPPVIDQFARTLAAPIAATKFSLSVSARVSSNYTPSAKYLHIDTESKGMKYVRIKENKVNLTANPEFLHDAATVDEELFYVVNNQPNIPELKRKVEARRVSYSRYKQYVINELGVDCVATIKQYWINDILDLIPSEYQFLDRYTVENLIDKMLHEINKDYYESVRKAILDYVLKDEDERMRLGIMQIVSPPVDYGDNIYMGLEPDQEWKDSVSYAKEEVLGHLVICSEATLEFKRIWTEYEKQLLVELPTKEDPPITIEDFYKLQEEKIVNAKEDLTRWVENIQAIYKAQLPDMDKKTAFMFFESNAALMYNQLRQLIMDTLFSYRDFFRRFKKEEYKDPEQVIRNEKDWTKPIEDVFILLEMKDEDNQIVFLTELSKIKSDLLKIIENITSVSQHPSRAESKMSRSEKSKLWEITHEDEVVQDITREVDSILDENLTEIAKVEQILNKYAYILTEDDVVDNFCQERDHTRKEYEQMITKYQLVYEQIMEEVPFYIRMSMINIDCIAVKKKLLQNCQDFIEKRLLTSILNIVNGNTMQINLELENIRNEIVRERVDSIDKLVELEAAVERVKTKDYKRIKEDFENLYKWLLMLVNTPFNLSDEEIKKVHETFRSIGLLMNDVDHTENRLRGERDDCEGKLGNDKQSFIQSLKTLTIGIDKLREHNSEFDQQGVNEEIDGYLQKIKDFEAQANDINQKEEKIGWQVTEFQELYEASSKLTPYVDLWRLIRDFDRLHNTWTRDKVVFKLNPDEVETEMKRMKKKSIELGATFKSDAPNPLRLTKKLRGNVEELEVHTPLVRILCNPGLEHHHWDQIGKVAEKLNLPSFGPDSNTTLGNLKNFNLIKEKKELEEIAESATKEYNIKNALKKMDEDWTNVVFLLNSWKDTGTYVVTGDAVDEIQLILDDQMVRTQTMKGSPYAKVFHKEIEEWEDFLNYTQNLINYWTKVQGVWLYLEPVFSSEDIMKQMPTEGAKFREVDASWKMIMSKIHTNPKLKDVTRNRKTLEQFKEANESLEVVQKGLNSYLETKRAAFPRFYFLSDPELLEILSETKDPLRVQPHLKKCFEGINKLQFDELKKIGGMFSSEGEYVPFITEVDAMAAKGAVEQWLIQVEDQMVASVREVIEIAFNEYKHKKRTDWILSRCGQAVLTVGMTYWTYETEEAMKAGGLNGLTEYKEKLVLQLEDIVHLVRRDVSKLDRATLQALIVLEVHNRDVVKQLVDMKVADTNDFSWLAQMRYYWEEANTKVRIINALCAYNYEYLGNSARLVITPLTDRCYRTLCGAVWLNYGGAPEGPAGTGKTETVKDLAKALARQCVVFNCSDGLDYKAMGKFFKGLASSGAWSCFDEFNRIDLEVLSVIAQQILTIQRALSQKVNQFEFEDATIGLKLTCNCFITMNPGYAGRSELPDNLKALFRAVAMMVPDYAMIAEISLYSYGFSNARILARKIVTTYKLCSEQLSSQKHYDYGMRAVKSVLVAAGNLKRKQPDEDESVLMLRAINDVNLAKFLSFDLPLFRGIISDLFPKVELPNIDYTDLISCIHNQTKLLKLQAEPYFVDKVIQLYEMILVRHGLMVVGLPFAGKTAILNVLAGSLTELAERRLMDEHRVHTVRINPKSIKQKQLYGDKDDVTQEWSDGVLAVKFRNFVKQEDDDRKWVIFDGPVDAVWIENMNTVLDDNKKLCLNSGEIIAMSNSMNMIFEPMDLLEASPATVSRCGMIYMEPEGLGWKPLFVSWRENCVPSTFGEPELERLDMLFNTGVDPLLNYRKTLKETSPTQDQNLVQSLTRMLAVLLQDFNDAKWFESVEMKQRFNIIDQKFMFAITWSIGGSLTFDSRKKFDSYLRRLVSGDITDYKFEKKINLPDSGQVFEYLLQLKEGKNDTEWVKWLDLVKTENISPKIQPHEIMVETTDTVRYSHLLKMFITNDIPTLFCGPTGTGKSVYIKNVLDNALSKDKFTTIELGFSAQTSENQTQEIIDSKLGKRKKDHYGPPVGKKVVIFVDDLNMPAKEKYGAQPPVEVLRQMVDQGGWYDYKDKDKPFKHIVDKIFISAMGPPGGGRTFITARFLRHLNLVSLAEFDEKTLNVIFSTIIQWYFNKNNFAEPVRKVENKLVAATLDIYKIAIEELRPTPLKSHYLFNLRDFAKVVYGICMADKDRVNTAEAAMRLWVHEVWRVFGDRLTNEDDKNLLLESVRSMSKRHFVPNFDLVFASYDSNKDGKVNTIEELRSLLFTDVLTAKTNKPIYEEVTESERVQETIEEQLELYNSTSDKPMDLVLFSFAIEHLLIICRILKQPGGNALLIGVGGSGRQSLTTLASYIYEYTVLQIEITNNYSKNDWREDIKRILKNAGGKGQQTVFLFTDSQIKEEGFVEDINTLLNTAEVPNLYTAEEKAELNELVRAPARQEGKALEGTPTQLYNYFIQKVKQNLHVVLCFSPIGDALRTRIRMFPSLVNCCTIDWFSAWPEDALYSVARKFVSDIDMGEERGEEIKTACTDMLKYFHESTTQWADKFYKQLKRKYYVTPTSYLEMIKTFKQLLAQKRKEVRTNINKYANGYERIITTEKTVGKMQERLTDMKPKLKEAAEDTAKKMEEVKVKKIEADKAKAVVSKEEEVAKAAADEANAIKDECELMLEEAMPAVREAETALRVLQPSQVNEVKALKSNPPIAIKQTIITIVMLTKRVLPERKKDPETMQMGPDWWGAGVKMLGDSNLLGFLGEFSKTIDSVEEKTIKQVNDFINSGDNAKILEVENVAKSSVACECFIKWAKGMLNLYVINKKVRPLKEKKEVAEKEANELSAQLEVKQKELKKIVDKVETLQRELEVAQKNKERLEKEFDECSKQLDRAFKLIDSLGTEKGRWAELAEQLKEFYVYLSGDVLVSSGMIAYLGAFTSAFRTQITEEWVSKCVSMKIPSSSTFSLQQVLGDPVKIRQWNIEGLPSDAFSVENAIIISKGLRWPLCIDPQGQANRWIKTMEKKNIAVVKLTDGENMRRAFESGIQFGTPVLLENVAEDLDPSLTPILLKQTYTKGASTYIRLGDKELDYSAGFSLYITTKYRNPHYLPEISTKVSLINFMITPEGLNDQLLGKVVSLEKPDLEQAKEKLILESAANKKQLAEIEAQILKVLSESENILSDDAAIEILTASKVTSSEIKEKQKNAEITEKQIDEARAGYSPVSREAACLFFVITDLANIDPMYQYSLKYFIDLFEQAIHNSEQSEELEIRLNNLQEYFQFSLYANICRSLFEKDKLLFSFLLCSRLMDFRGTLAAEDYRFLLTGGIALDEKLPPKPEADWVSDKAWGEIVRLGNIESFKGFASKFAENIGHWSKIYSSPQPQKEPLPDHCSAFSWFQKLVVLRSVRPDKLILGIQEFVKHELGEKFVEPPPFNLADVFKDSTVASPLIFVLSPGSDPTMSLLKFAEIKGKKFDPISLGQGQGPRAQKAIDEACKTGNWVCLQNCHLAIRWMPILERICESFTGEPKPHPEFRLWLTSYPSPHFPVAILQNGIKMTNEPPKGLRANLFRSYQTDPISDQEFFESCNRPREWKKLLYGLCFFHAVIQERRKFGPLGWNIPYEFNESDLRISVRQLCMFLNEYPNQVPFDALKYLTAECNYGGRVTDDKDRRLIITLLNDYYCESMILNDDYHFAPVDYCVTPKDGDYEPTLEWIKSKIDANPTPDVFGLHPNADITKDLNETGLMLNSLMSCQSDTGGQQADSMDDVLDKLCQAILSDFPKQYDLEAATQKYPVSYEESMNTVLTQELQRFNGLVKVINESLADIQKALKGLILLSSVLEKTSQSLFNGKVPDQWMAKSYPSLKPLGGYISDLKARLDFFKSWLDNGPPTTFWLSGFYFTQSFLTGVLQNYARKHTIPIDEIVFDFEVFADDKDSKPEDGAYVNGLFIEGAKWDYDNMELGESDPKVLFVKCPTILMKPCRDTDLVKYANYNCPVYKTSARRGELSTTGHSTNFVMSIRLPSHMPEQHWVKRGVAMLTQLDD